MNELWWYGLLGALLPDIIRLARDRYGLAPDHFRNWWFWTGLAAQLAIGLVAVLLGDPEKPVSGAALGFGGAEIISRLLGAAPPGTKQSDPVAPASKAAPGPPSARPRTLLEWWAV